jgi:hypothetical protein
MVSIGIDNASVEGVLAQMLEILIVLETRREDVLCIVGNLFFHEYELGNTFASP